MDNFEMLGHLMDAIVEQRWSEAKTFLQKLIESDIPRDLSTDTEQVVFELLIRKGWSLSMLSPSTESVADGNVLYKAKEGTDVELLEAALSFAREHP